MPSVSPLSLGQRLVRERLRLNWSQEEVARALEISARSVNRWEHDKAVPYPHHRQQLCGIFQVSSETLFGTISNGESTPSSAFWTLPYSRNPFFIGRDEILSHLHETFHASTSAAFVQVQALRGLGGIGKTQTAIEYAYRYCDDYSAVLWLRAETSELLLADVIGLANVLKLPENNEQNQQRVVEGVKRWLDRQESWLLILDNVEDMSMVQDFLPSHGRGHTLMTTRAQATGMTAMGVDIEPLHVEEATLFLLHRAKLLSPDASLQLASETCVNTAKEISLLMNGLPLALDQAGAYIEETGCSLSDYLDRYQHHQATLLDLRSEAHGSHPLSVRATLSLCFEQVKQINSTAADVIRLCAFLHPDAIPEEMFSNVSAYLSLELQRTAESSIALDTAFAALRTLSFLRRHPTTKTVSIHRLVQTVVKDAMDERTQRQWAERAIQVVNNLFPITQSDVQDLHRWSQHQNYLPHALVASRLIDQWHLSFSEASHLLHKMGMYFLARADYSQAEMFLQKARENRIEALGEIHPDVAESFNALGDLFYYQGKYEQAEAFLQRALWIREQTVDATHPDIASNLSKLARLYQEQGKYTQGEPLLQQALTIHEQNVGPEHPDVADVLNSLGFLYRRQGKLIQAEPLLQRALFIYEQNMEPEHPDVLFSLTYLASLFYDQGKYEQAKDYYLRTLTIREHVMGLEHPHVATSLNDVARVYRIQGKYTQAEPLFQRAVAIYKKTIGEEHPYTATSLMNLAVLYREMDRYTQAELLFHQAIAIYEKTVGSEHPRMAQCLSELATLHVRQGHNEQAEGYFQEALRIREFQLGQEHPETMATLVQYVNLLRNMKREKEAAVLEVRIKAVELIDGILY